MKTLSILFAAFAALSTPGLAADDPIAARQALMDNNGAAGAVATGLIKGEIPYSPVVAKATVVALAATAASVGAFFPEGSADAKRSNAAPKIWEDMAGFQVALAKFQTAVATAKQAAGKDGPADVAAYKAAIGPVFDACKGCHETYRLKQN